MATLPRGPVPITVLNAAGQPVSGASVQIRKRPDAAQTLYAAETGTGTTANPATANSKGRITGWLPMGTYTANVSGTGITSYSEHFDIKPGAYTPIEVALGGALPSSPVNGDQVYYNCGDGVQWNLRYNSTSGKWDFIGGSAIHAFEHGPITQSLTSTPAAIVGGPEIFFPRTGTYEIETFCIGRPDEGATLNWAAFATVNGVALTNAWAPRRAAHAAFAMGTPGYRINYTAASTAFPLKLFAMSATTRTFILYDIAMSIRPTRLDA